MLEIYDLEGVESGPAAPVAQIPRKPQAKASSSERGRSFFGSVRSLFESRSGIAVLFCAAAIFGALRGVTNHRKKEAADAAPIAVKTAPITFSDLGAPKRLEPGVLLYEVFLGAPQPGPGVAPGHSGKLWLYLPEGEHAPHSLPCILITGAGSILITGMGLGDGDRPEHLPYVRAGYAVLAYEMDGNVDDPQSASNEELKQAVQAFLAADAGLVNARIALDFLSAKVPQVDPERIATAGHSSAGTAAILVAENEPRIKACIAYAPCIDLNQRFSFAQKLLVRSFPGGSNFLTKYNPMTRLDSLGCPLFLFHAEDDSNVPCKPNRKIAEKLQAQGRRVTFVTVPSGDHYDSMINEGIPAGMAWLAENGFAPTRAH
jgi:dienelactone hydrolase